MHYGAFREQNIIIVALQELAQQTQSWVLPMKAQGQAYEHGD